MSHFSIQSMIIKTAKGLLRLFKPFIPHKLDAFYAEYRRETLLRDRSQVILFTAPGEALLFPGYPQRHALPAAGERAGLQPVKVSLVATLRNEAANCKEWMASLLEQTRRPDEVVLTDGGSTDGTLALIQEWAHSFPIPIQLIEAPGANIAQGRNIAIQQAAHPIIACTDFGCLLDKTWLERLVAPFEIDPQIDVSCGYYQVAEELKINTAPHTMAALAREYFGINIQAINPQEFLPSSRSLAMKKALWEYAGRYPEWLSYAGEDTLFDYQAKSQPSRWAFVPGAKVIWKSPASLSGFFKTYYRYALGDGETGIFAHRYWWKTVELGYRLLTITAAVIGLILVALLLYRLAGQWSISVLPAGILLAGLVLRWLYNDGRMSGRLGTKLYPYSLVEQIVSLLQVAGFARGVLNRPAVKQRQIQYYQAQLHSILHDISDVDAQHIIVYPPTHDWGFMFQRPHQMARAFARRGYLYFYCTQNELQDAVYGFRCVEPGLYLCHVPMETFAALQSPIVYLGSAWRRHMLHHFSQPYLIYDHYDDLKVSGANPVDHEALLQASDLVLVTSRLLLEAVKSHRNDALFIPNGVDYDLIQQNRPPADAPLPEDWQAIANSSRPVIGYSGALAEWFDYELLTYLALHKPDFAFVLIGVDYDGSLGQSEVLKLPNVHWLGMKTYPALFAYIWRFDIAIIPFCVNEITLATSPIKMYEYMACGKPVVSSNLPECRQMPGLFIAKTCQEFANLVDQALDKRQDNAYLALIDQLARQNTWINRADRIIARMKEENAERVAT